MPMRHLFTALVCLLSAPALAMPTAADVAQLSGYLTGAYDSEAQNTAQVAEGLSEDERHTRVTILQRQVDLPAFGGHVLYNEEYRDGDPSKLIRQRLVRLVLDADENAIRMTQYFFNTPADYVGAHLDPKILSSLAVGDVWLLPGCDVFWQRDGDSFTGGMKDGACVFAFPEGARAKTVIYKVTIDADTFHRTDRSVWTDSGDVSGGRADDEPTIHGRVVAPWD